MRGLLILFLWGSAVATASKQQPLEPLTKFRAIASLRWGGGFVDGRLLGAQARRTEKQQTATT